MFILPNRPWIHKQETAVLFYALHQVKSNINKLGLNELLHKNRTVAGSNDRENIQ